MMGSALSVPLADAGHDVRLVGTHLDGPLIEGVLRDRQHSTLKESIPARVQPYFHRDLHVAMENVDIIALGVSSAGIDWAASAIAPYVRPDVPIVMVTKGLRWENDALSVLPDVLESSLHRAGASPSAPVGIAGPCIAGELARRVPTCVVFAGRDARMLDRLSEAAQTGYYHVRPSTDVVGAEVCAALKNAYAMGIALGAGLHEAHGGAPGSVAMHNYESAVFAQSIVEMNRLVARMGGAPETASGLAGVGDLDVTCNGGRTGRFGRMLGLGLGVETAIAQMGGATLECIEILKTLRPALRGLVGGQLETSLPLVSRLMRIVLDGAPAELPFERFFR